MAEAGSGDQLTGAPGWAHWAPSLLLASAGGVWGLDSRLAPHQ